MSEEVPPLSGLQRAMSMTDTAAAKSPKQSPAELKRRGSVANRAMNMGTFKFSAALDAAETGGGEDIDVWEEARLKIKKFMRGSYYGKMYENFLLVFSVFSAVEYIYETYLNYSQMPDRVIIGMLDKIELAVASLFAIDWLLNLFLADHKLLFVTSFFSMIDIFSVIPIYATFGRVMPDVSRIYTFEDAALYSMFALGTTRVLRALRVRRKLLRIEDAVDRYLVEICVNISVMILFFTAVMNFIEYEYQDLDFHTWIWYIWVTISTVGYGDISPLTTQGRIAAMCIIGFSIISIPKMTNELIEKMALQSVYARAVYTPKTRKSSHVVVVGDLGSTSLNEFFAELFHEDHDNVDLKAVILLPNPPTKEMIFLMRDSQFFLSLTYLQGSALVDNDLRRAKAESANAIFIMTNKFTQVPDEEDAKSILLNLSIKRYLSFFDVPPKLYCMQLIRPQNRRHLSRAADKPVLETDLVVCLNEIKMGVLAKAVMFPGANTLLMNLISSFSDDPDADKKKDDEHSNDIVWTQEYEKGCDWEIYTTQLSSIFEGAKFSELSFALYDKIGVVLFALQITENKPNGQSKLLLNPAEYTIPSQGEYLIEAFVIAQNKASSDLSFTSSGGRDFDPSGIGTINRMNRNINTIGTFMSNTGQELRRKSSIMDNGGPKRLSHDEIRARHSFLVEEQRKQEEEVKKAEEEAAAKKKTSKWMSLKRSALLEKKVESFSFQEIMSQLEDKHNTQNYYLREEPAEISDVFVKTNVTEEVPFINNHTIIVGKGFNNLFDLIRPLRAKHLGPLRFIVLLTPHDIPHDIWTRIAMFDAILVVRGSPLEESNLRRAGIFRATQVVVLADGSSDKSGSGMEALVDSDAIFSYQCVKRMNPNAQVVVEIVNTSNISYLDDDLNLSDSDDYKFSNQFAAGTLFTTSLLDSIVCQAYYNPSIIKVMNKLLSGVDQLDRAELAAEANARANAGESSTLTSAKDKEVSASNDSSESDEDEDTFNVNKAPAIKTPVGSGRFNKSAISAIEGSCLYQMKIPENLEKNNYGCLYQHLALQGIVPLGLLRGTFAGMNYGPRHNRMPFVYTNPEKDTELYKCDRVFVLSTKPIQLLQKLDVKDWILDLQMQRSKDKPGTKGTMIRKSRSASNLATLESLDIHQKKLEARVSKLSSDVNKRMNTMMRLMEQCVQNTSGMSVVMEGSGSEAGSGSTGPAGLVVGSKANYDDHKLGSRGRVDSSMSQHSDEGDSAKYRDRKASIQTNDSTVTNGAYSATYMGEEETPPGTSRSRRSSIGSVEATPQSILRKSSITSGTAPACANNATDSPSGKKRHSFSDPIATEFIFDKDGSVSTPPPANRAVTAAKQLAVLVAAHEKGQEIERATDASHGSRGTTSPGSEEDDSLPSKEDEGTGAGTGAGAGAGATGTYSSDPDAASRPAVRGGSGRGKAPGAEEQHHQQISDSEYDTFNKSVSSEALNSLGIIETDTDLNEAPGLRVKLKPDQQQGSSERGGFRSVGASPRANGGGGINGCWGLGGGGTKSSRTASEYALMQQQPSGVVAGPPVSLTESPVQPERMARIRALSASSSRKDLTPQQHAGPSSQFSSPKRIGNPNSWVD